MLIAKNPEVETIKLTTIQGLPFVGNVTMKVMMAGENMNMLEISYPAGSSSPPHEHESVAYVISGKIKGTIEGDSVILGPGDACRHPEGVEHSVAAIKDAVSLEIKSPPQPLDQFIGPG
jgi:quercetin dioxygenase-like cupin family protein